MSTVPPPLAFLAQVRCEVGALVNLGAGPYGERRCVPLLGGSVSGPGLNGEILPGGADWQILRADGPTPGAVLTRVAVMQRLARGEAVAPGDYFFRTLMRFQTGHADWLHLNATMALARGERQAQHVVLDVFRIG